MPSLWLQVPPLADCLVQSYVFTFACHKYPFPRLTATSSPLLPPFYVQAPSQQLLLIQYSSHFHFCLLSCLQVLSPNFKTIYGG
jgi:hypothetical protein